MAPNRAIRKSFKRLPRCEQVARLGVAHNKKLLAPCGYQESSANAICMQIGIRRLWRTPSPFKISRSV
jgi:hypothetical protein